MNNKYFKILLSTVLLIFFSFATLLVWQYVLALVFMEDEITFSASVLICFFATPLILYTFSCSVFFFIFDRQPKYNTIISKYLIMIAFASLIFSFPISLYVNYKLIHDGYFTCDKISWMSPTTYVKDLSLCR